MSMEIKGPGGRPPVEPNETSQTGASQTNYSGRTGSGADTSSSQSSRADTFSLTNQASQLQQLEAQISQLPVVDTQRVEDVQHAIATGTLQIQPARVADKLLQFEAGLSSQVATA